MLQLRAKVDQGAMAIKRYSARGVMVIVVGNGHGDTSSNPRRDIAFLIALISLGNI